MSAAMQPEAYRELYTIIGGAVNLASRLEHEAPPGGFLLSYETYAHVKEEIACEARGEVRVRGIAYPVATYAVVGPRIPTAQSVAEAEIDWAVEVAKAPASFSEADCREAAARLARAADQLGGLLATTDEPASSIELE